MKRLYLLLLVVFALFISLTSVSYAYTYDDLLLYCQQSADVELNTTSGYKTGFYYQYQTLLSKDTTIRSLLNQHYSNANYFILSNTYNGGTRFDTRILCYSVSPTGFTHSTSKLSGHNDTWAYINISGGTYLGQVTIWNNSVSYSSNNETKFYSNYDSQSPKALFLIGDVDLSSGGYTGYNINGLIPPYTGPEFTVSTFNNSTIPVHYGSNSDNFYRLQYSTSMRLKDLGNISNFEDVYSIVGYFGPYVTDDIIDGSQSTFFYNKYGGTQNGTLVFYEDTGLVQIRTSKLIPNQGYNLNLAYQTERNGEWTDFADVNFYAYYYGNNPSSGDLVSPDLNSTVDIGFVNALDEFFNPTSGEISEASESIFQNPFGSGEFFGITYTDYDDWGFGDFVIGLFEGIYNIFNDFTDVSINFGFLGAVSSEAFITTGFVHSFLAIFTDAIFIIMMVFWYFRLVRAFSTFDLTAISKYDFDQMFNMF